MALNLHGISAAMFNTPSNYIDSAKYYNDTLQQKIDDTFQYASNTSEIEHEEVIGSNTFIPVLCRVCHAIEPKTGKNLGDDFKDLKFFNNSAPRIVMGDRYRFDGSVWITTNTDNLHYVTKSSIVRRCNNTLNFIDASGNIVREPCIIDYTMKYANFYYNTTTEIPQGTINITVQANDNTEWIDINDRFIINGKPYKTKAVKNYLRNKTDVVMSNPMIEFEMFIDAKSPDDDLTLEIANMNQYKDIYPPKPVVVKNGVVISPETNEIFETKTVVYSCYNYINDVAQPDVFTFTPSGASTQYYNFIALNENSFSIQCLGYSEVPLVIQCLSGVLNKTITINLKGLF